MLGLEFSAARRSVAVGVDGEVRSQVREIAPRESGPLSMIEQALREAGLEREAIEVLVVGLGPGSYTGIRVAIALAQGWQLATPVKLMGVSSADGLASQAIQSGLAAELHVAFDAQRTEFYLGTYRAGSPGCRPVTDLRLAPRSDLVALLDRGEAVVAPEPIPGLEGVRVLAPDASFLLHGLPEAGPFVEGATLEPIYLREVSFVKAPPPRPIPSLGDSGDS